jgi:hypothetical protein
MADDVSVFISYSHRDREWCEQIERALKALKFSRLDMNDLKSGRLHDNAHFTYSAWTDKEIYPGQNWALKIDEAIAKARIALLLVSTDFLASEFILAEEIPRLYDRQEERELAIMPLVVRPCVWGNTAWLQGIEVYPKGGTALSTLSAAACEEMLQGFMAHIDQTLDAEKTPESDYSESVEQPSPTPTTLHKGQIAYDDALTEPNSPFWTWTGVRKLIDESDDTTPNEFVVGGLCLVRTKIQRTWIAVTPLQVFCVLDGEKTRKGNRIIQWRIPLDQGTPVRARERASARLTGLINIGPKQNWLYSRRLHPDARALEKQIEELVKEARAVP